jgi:RNA polymerase sigma-70 factor (ECF subfamily)
LLKTSATETEAMLVSRAQAGDREAFSEIVRHYHQGMINVVYRMCGDGNLAEDAAQTALIHAWQRLQSYRPQASFRSWLYRIALNAALDILRRQKPDMDVEKMPLVSSEDQPDVAVERQERLEQVRRAVLALPEASRAVIVLREYEGLSYQEIAGVLDIPLGTVMSRLNYARTRLLETLKPYLEET